MSDPVLHPKHYEVAPGLEAIDVIRATLTPEEFRGYCIGNLLKYRLRAGKKDALEQDIAKANNYARMLEEQPSRAGESELPAGLPAHTVAYGPVEYDFTAKPLYEKPGAFYVVPKGYYKKPETFGVLISESEHLYREQHSADECKDCATCTNLNCPRR